MRRRRLIGWSTLVLVVAAGTVAVLQTGMTEVASVRVQGVEQLDPGEVRRASGISPGMNAIGLDLQTAATKVEALPLVEDATVSKDGAFEVVITVTERRPRLIVVAPDGRRGVDADAVAMSLPASPVALTLPELTVDRIDDLEPSTTRAAIRLWDRLRAAERKRAAMSWGAVHGLSMQLGPTWVRFGSGEDLGAKVDAYRAIRHTLGAAPRRVDLTQFPRIGVVG